MADVLVTGGTGKTGSRVARQLAEEGASVRVASRAAPTRFDWDDVATHAPALEGVDRVYLVPPVLVADPAPVMTRFIELALATGVRRVVLLSASAIPESDSGVGAVHRAVRERAPEWAVLRPSWFMQNFIDDGHHHCRSIRADGALVTAAGDGRVPFVDADDIAAVAVRALLDDVAHNTDHVITGPRAMSYDEVAAAISSVAGRPVTHVRVVGDEAAQRMVDAGMPASFAEILAALDAAIAAGAEDRVTPTVEHVTGRPPRDFAAFVAAHADAWRHTGAGVGTSTTTKQ